MTLALLAVSLLTAAPAAPKAKPENLSTQLEQLRREVALQRQVLTHLLHDQRQRTELLLQLLDATRAEPAPLLPAAVSPAPAAMPPVTSSVPPAPAAAAQAPPGVPPVPAALAPVTRNVAPAPAAEPSPAPAPADPSSRAATPTAKRGRFKLSGKVSAEGGALPHGAWVFVQSVRGRATGKTAEIRQQNKTFTPASLAVQVGTRLSFPNLDAVFHDVFSRSPGNVFDLGPTQAGEATKSTVLTAPGVVEVFCNFHAKMRAQVLVVPGPLYAPVAADGSFTLEGVPAGTQTLVAWAPGARESSLSVDVSADVTELELAITPTSQRPHLNKSGLPYGSYGD